MHVTPHLAIATSLALFWSACSRPVELHGAATPCVTDTDCAAGGSCAVDSDCPAGTTCSFDGTCVVTCDTVSHTCLRDDPCASDADCPMGAACAGGACVATGPPGCRSDADCPGGSGCDTGTSTCK